MDSNDLQLAARVDFEARTVLWDFSEEEGRRYQRTKLRTRNVRGFLGRSGVPGFSESFAGSYNRSNSLTTQAGPIYSTVRPHSCLRFDIDSCLRSYSGRTRRNLSLLAVPPLYLGYVYNSTRPNESA